MIENWQYEETETLEIRINRLFWELKQSLAFDQASILLAVYRSEFVRADVEAELTQRLRELGQRTERVYINEQNHDLPMALRSRADRATTVFFVSGVRFGGGRDGQNAYRALNIRREYFVEYGLRMVLWLTEEEERLLPRYAPDFWAFRHRVVTFFDEPRPEQVGKYANNLAWREVDSTWGGKGYTEDTEAKIVYRERLLVELPMIPETVPNLLDLLYTLAPLYAARGEFEKAIATFKQIIEVAAVVKDKSRQSGSYHGIGNVYSDLRQFDEAIAAYQKAIELDPNLAYPHNGLGNVYQQNGRYPEAIAAYQKAIELDPNNALSHNGLGNVYSDNGRYPEAIAAYQKAIELDPNFAAPHNGLGNVYRQNGRYPEAIAAYQKAIELDPNNALPHNGLGTLYRQNGRYPEAIAAYQKAIELDPNDAAIRGSLAGLYRKLGRDAEYKAQAAIARTLIDKEDEYNRACFEAICGNTDAAIALLEQAIAQAPGRRQLAQTDPRLRLHPRRPTLPGVGRRRGRLRTRPQSRPRCHIPQQKTAVSPSPSEIRNQSGETAVYLKPNQLKFIAGCASPRQK
jgi:tetratricopeptide (TPR) repeat protein